MSFWDLAIGGQEAQQNRKIRDLEERATRAMGGSRLQGKNVRDLSVQIAELRQELGRMAMYVEAMSRLLLEKSVCTQEELISTLTAVDAEDGVIDDQRAIPRTPGWCAKCSHQNEPAVTHCKYCGADLRL